MKRWLWLLPGLAVGVGLGLLIGWVIAPVTYYDTVPAQLHPLYQEEYVRLVALTYAVTQDLEAAQCDLIGPESDRSCGTTARSDGGADRGRCADPVVIESLARLAQDLDAEMPVMAPYLRETR